MLTSLFRRSVANSRSLNVAAFRSVHSMTFRAAVGNTNSVYGGAFQSPSFLQSECVGVSCVQRYSPSILSPTLSKIFARGFKTQLKKPKTKLKTKKAAKKRFILTGRGKLKRNHSGKQHLTGHMSRKRKTRLNAKVFLTGTNLKNMKKLINV